MAYFEHMIPDRAPYYIHPSAKPRFEAAAFSIRSRMEKLNEAHVLSGLRGEVFSTAAMPLFRNRDIYGDPVLDSMTAKELADAAKLLACGVLDVPERMEWPNCRVVVDTAYVTIEEWEAIRMLGIGGSDSANILNEGYGSARSVYYDKTGELDNAKTQEDDPGKEFIFAYGHCVESLVIDEFCRRSGAHRVPETRMFCHKDHPELTANIDQIVQFPDGRFFVFEAKTTNARNKEKWEGGMVPRQYIYQCHKYPLVLNDDRICGTYIGCIFGNTPDQFACSFVDRDKQLEEEQRDREVKFWEDHVLAGVVPPPSGDPEKDTSISKMKAGKSDPKLGVLLFDPDVYADNLSLYLKLKEEVKTLEKQIDSRKVSMAGISNKLIEELGGSVFGECVVPDRLAPSSEAKYKWLISHKPKKGTTIDKELLKHSFPQAYAACVHENPEASRSFSLKMVKTYA